MVACRDVSNQSFLLDMASLQVKQPNPGDFENLGNFNDILMLVLMYVHITPNLQCWSVGCTPHNLFSQSAGDQGKNKKNQSMNGPVKVAY